jgi:hypothetical protein
MELLRKVSEEKNKTSKSPVKEVTGLEKPRPESQIEPTDPREPNSRAIERTSSQDIPSAPNSTSGLRSPSVSAQSHLPSKISPESAPIDTDANKSPPISESQSEPIPLDMPTSTSSKQKTNPEAVAKVSAVPANHEGNVEAESGTDRNQDMKDEFGWDKAFNRSVLPQKSKSRTQDKYLPTIKEVTRQIKGKPALQGARLL